ncbi:MAG: DUF2752 domain-containing protein [Prevotellaceae bacterium]|jgi:hypothetical protein|nr:DUF2752 domain-containing protein [Prevotellaceae bacterium]
MKKKIILTLAIVSILAGVSIYFVVNPSESIYFPPCPFYLLTGFQCPGCGSQRAIHSLLHLDFKQAFLYNPLLIPALLLVGLLVYLGHFGGKNRFPHLYRTLSGTKFTWAVFIVIVLFGIGRNVFGSLS